uniref:Uncharacterized protein n=2 Tax=Oryza sativa subsp. japonica TaxID=39947 RepID=Q10SJ0_ORYSJ|nr:Hypothetical protein [Oryza sativa Japonica Group]ABF93698.1 hypothetical protein LOC_Os03g02910 [Oryza sativa Japonica Group]
MHQITTVHGEIGDKERWGMDGPESIASRPGGERSGEVDGGVTANQGFDVPILELAPIRLRIGAPNWFWIGI